MFDDLKDMFGKRWQEMLLIVGFMAIGVFLFELLNAEVMSMQQSLAENALASGAGNMSQATSFLYSMAAMAFMVLWLMFYLGFLATLNINYGTALTPTMLLIIGRRFFWRMVRFQIVIGLCYFAVSMLIFSAMKGVFFPSVPDESVSLWAYAICATISTAVLAKPILLIPPIMICKNCKVRKAVTLMPKYKILDIKILPIIFISGFVVTVVVSTIRMSMRPDAEIVNVIIASKAILTGVISLTTGTIGIWFIGGGKFGVLEEMLEVQDDDEQQSVN